MNSYYNRHNEERSIDMGFVHVNIAEQIEQEKKNSPEFNKAWEEEVSPWDEAGFPAMVPLHLKLIAIAVVIIFILKIISQV